MDSHIYLIINSYIHLYIFFNVKFFNIKSTIYLCLCSKDILTLILSVKDEEKDDSNFVKVRDKRAFVRLSLV